MKTASSDDAEEAEPVDWAEVFTTLVSHTSIKFQDIGEMTIPQIEAVLDRLGKHVNLKLGIPLSETVEPQPQKAQKTSTVSDLQKLVGMFGGLG